MNRAIMYLYKASYFFRSLHHVLNVLHIQIAMNKWGEKDTKTHTYIIKSFIAKVTMNVDHIWSHLNPTIFKFYKLI